jgi:hypothetical protein
LALPEDTEGPGLEPEAQHLVSALEKFIHALLRLHIAQQRTNESEKGNEIARQVPETVPAPTPERSSSIGYISQSTGEEFFKLMFGIFNGDSI